MATRYELFLEKGGKFPPRLKVEDVFNSEIEAMKAAKMLCDKFKTGILVTKVIGVYHPVSEFIEFK